MSSIAARGKLEASLVMPARVPPAHGEGHGAGGLCSFIGDSEPMRVAYRTIEAAARSMATVFITGESGTGKEVAAETIHKLSPRSAGPFGAINCGAIPRDLIESELFGHLKGSFTGAVVDRMGAIKHAHGGTLLLDEIGELPIELQSKLLRFLQSSVFMPVGSDRPEKADIRIICATNRDPLAEVRLGRFREDLYYRLHVLPIIMPPLRERGADAVLIARRLLTQFAPEEGKAFTRFTEAAERFIAAYAWPGNVRQLQNIVRNLVVMHSGTVITETMLAEGLEPARPPASADPGRMATGAAQPSATVLARLPTDPAGWRSVRDIVPLSEVERLAIERAIMLCEGNVPRAAALLGVSASTLYRKRQGWETGARRDEYPK